MGHRKILGSKWAKSLKKRMGTTDIDHLVAVLFIDSVLQWFHQKPWQMGLQWSIRNHDYAGQWLLFPPEVHTFHWYTTIQSQCEHQIQIIYFHFETELIWERFSLNLWMYRTLFIFILRSKICESCLSLSTICPVSIYSRFTLTYSFLFYSSFLEILK